ncbi:FAD-dependent oxidoreductase [Polyangium sorediatum]|uniref:NAD(P)/FAD-dependent oxidoreductase n=1 Tax=Polyangium sorediatum TaxID=889274 RepID=A0ABT6NJA0_9BACT|nr:NAD(P)/FAD-dependent oxidoreductase [Polyangium sorediatum]MDI1428374.1 NAD(P)/FAD-dependent oxidoreductase [Polyangium sorediatum]
MAFSSALRGRMKPIDVGIIGCGTAGSAAALFLSRAGHRVTVYERVPDPGPVGAGVMLQPTGQAVLGVLGLREAVLARCTPITRMICRTAGGRQLFDLRYGDIPGDHVGYGLHRGVLFEHLFRAVRAANVNLRLGVSVENLENAGRGRGLYFVTPEGERLGPHAVCVVADGARSQLRDDTTIGKRIRPYPWGALWFVGEDPGGAFRGALAQVVRGTEHMVGLLPTGFGPGEGPATDKVSLFYSLPVAGLDAWREAGLDAWKSEVRALAPSAAPVLDQIDSAEEVLFARYHDVSMYPWNDDRVVYLGDAAHAMSPQLGQGANLALWDAMVLAEALAAHESLPIALDAYSRARRSHLDYYQFVTRWLTPFFQSDLAPLGWLRDLGFPLATALPFLRRLMVRSMCGIAQGIGIDAPILLPAPDPVPRLGPAA